MSAEARLELWALVGRLRAQRAVPARLKVEAADAALRISALLAGTDAGRPPVRLGRGQAQAIIVELLDALTGAGIAWQDIVADVTTYRQARPGRPDLRSADLRSTDLRPADPRPAAERETVHV